MDFRTSGPAFNEPLQILVLRYKEGRAVEIHNQYLLPMNGIEDSAI